MIVRYLGGLSALLAVSSCASGVMTEEACRAADWQGYGYQDGVAGAPPSLANERGAACQKHGVQMDYAAYYDGRDRGLGSFCSPPRGFRMGASGTPYRGQCAAYDEAAFTAEYERGWADYVVSDAVEQARYHLGALRAQRDAARREIAGLAAGGFAELSPEQVARRTALAIQTERRLTDIAIPEATARLRLAERALAEHRDATRQAVLSEPLGQR